MKPKEFDELIKQKFDRNDFAYNPENWDQLAEKLDGRDKKRSLIVWWWIPLAGMAASVALAFGVSSLLRLSAPVNIGGSIAHTQKSNSAQPHSFLLEPGMAQNQMGTDDNSIVSGNSHKRNINNNPHKKVAGNVPQTNPTYWTEVTLRNALGNTVVVNSKPFDLLSKDAATLVKKDKQIGIDEPVTTFKPDDEVKKAPAKLSVILSGGVNHGNENSGYMAGATIRRMLNNGKMYIESDVAFASSSNTQMTEYAVPQAQAQPVAARTTAARLSQGARTTSASPESNKALPAATETDIIEDKNVSYNLYYAQVSPSLGYKVIKKVSIGLGPDFQRMLVDNRPAPSTVDRDVVQVAPLFDIGFIGKTEYALTKKVKAGIYYRKGVNNLITPTDKYIDRDYLQFQVKYTIFNK